MKKIGKIPTLLFGLIIPSLTTSCSTDNNFYFANFESYISPILLNELESDKSVGLNGTIINHFNYRTFSTNEDLERNFSTNYDVAVPSTYLAVELANEGKLMVIDWSKFGLYKLDKNGNRILNSDGKTYQKIENATDALTLFTPQVRAILTAYDLSDAAKYLKANYPDEYQIYEQNESAGLLNFCVPYFLQDFRLAYKSSDGSIWTFPNDNSYTWNDAIETLTEKVKDGTVSKIASINDSRSLYSIARLIQTGNNVNPGPVQTSQSTTLTPTLSINDYESTYKVLSNDIKKNTYYLNTDSNNVLNSFALPDGCQAILSYNGDILFACQGGDNYGYNESNTEPFKNWIKNYFSDDGNGDSFLIKNTYEDNYFVLLDTMVINRKRVTEKNDTNLAYSVLYKIGLEGADQSLYTDSSKTAYADQDNDTPIFATDKNQNYCYGPMLNFSYVQYTSPLLTLNAYVLNSSSNISQYINATNSNYTGIQGKTANQYGTVSDSLSTSLQGQGFFTSIYDKNQIVKSDTNPNGFLNQQQYQNYIETLIDFYQMNNPISVNNIPRNISDLNKSNMSWAYSDVKSNYF